MLEIHSVQLWGAGIFGLAVLHTFLTQPLLKFSHRFERGSALESIFHLLGEIEVVFGIWAAVFLGISGFSVGITPVRDYLENLHFTEPIFVFVVMVISSSKPIMFVARRSIQMLSSAIRKVTGIPAILVDVFVVLAVGPLLGSLITEPAAMTVTALLLYSLLRQPSVRMMYFALAVLFVNVSIGGALSHFAAPPILMVAGTWGWDTSFVFFSFWMESDGSRCRECDDVHSCI